MPTMHDPAHPGESLRDAMAAEGWTVTEAATKLGCTRQAFSRVLNGEDGHLARYGAGTGTNRVEQRSVWVRGQAHYDLARARPDFG